MKVEAWLLEKGPPDTKYVPATLRKGVIDLGELGSEEVLVEPIYGCWEGNMGHAVDRNPIDVCITRRENKVVIGNAGVVRVLKTGGHFPDIHPGQIYMLFSGDTTQLPRYSYPLKAYAYDSGGTVGLLAKQTKVHYKQLFAIPTNSRFSLKHWAAFSLRYVTAWGNWKVAQQTYRSMVSIEDEPKPTVFGWGGGVSLAMLQLAKNSGFDAALIASNEERLNLIHKLGLVGVDRKQFPHLDYRFMLNNPSREEKANYIASERKFLEIVKEKTHGIGVSIFIDLIGEPVLKATIKALARPAVLTTAGWKGGMNISYMRAIECQLWHAHIHTHYGSMKDAKDAIQYGETEHWMPPLGDHERVYQWTEINELLEDYRANNTNYFPIYEINKE